MFIKYATWRKRENEFEVESVEFGQKKDEDDGQGQML
jgi:hypothetical protein